ncbi:AAA family ATPase [Chryseobacterium sp. SIMBA_038]|uniref:AAA family ATPase n=1 Tax=Chryseobacterium sp. SIMBA_038 TaxID=3085780 RepID=UPI00397BAF15
MNQNEITYSQEVTKALNIAQKIGRENLNKYFNSAHLLKAMLNRDLGLLKQLENLGIDVFYLEEWAEVRIEESPKSSTNIYSCEPDEIIDEIFAEADSVREILDEEEISLFAVMTAISSPGVAFSFDQMKTFPTTRNELLKDVNSFGLKTESEPSISKKTSNTFIKKYCINKNDQVKSKNKKELLVGRDTEINKITEILCRFSKQNVLIIGDHGVGKTALIEGFIQKNIAKQIPDVLSGLQIFELDMGVLVAGASYKGEIEDRIKSIAQEFKAFPKSVLIIEEFHSLFGNQGSDSGIVNLLKSEISNGLTIIATSTIEEYTKKIEKEQGLAGMFELLKLEETEDETHLRMLKQTLEDYQIHHKIKVDDETMKEAIRLSKRYMKEKSLPASAIDLIDHTMSVLKTAGESFLKEKNHLLTKIIHLEDNSNNYSDTEQKQHSEWQLKDLIEKTKYLISTSDIYKEEGQIPEFENADEILKYSRELINNVEKIAQQKRTHITELDLALIISQKTNIPIGKLKEEEKQRLNDMENVLAKRVVGQDHAISIVSEAVLETRSGLSKAGQPIGSFFFLGPTGTGKTELAKSLAEFLFQDENAIIRFDMSEFKEEHSAALLYGAPPGYVGYEEGGLLVNKIRQKPYSIVLFDEIEKAHASVFDVFLQIMDEGKLHDRLGKEGDFSNAIILFTSNIGSEFIVESFGKGEIPPSSKLMEMMSRFFRPEFLGRLTETIPFAPISRENALKIFEIHLKKELLDLVKNLNIELIITQEAKEFLSMEGYDIKYGARPLKGIIRGSLRRPLAKKIVAGEYKEGDKVEVSLENNDLIWKKIN